MKLIGVILGGLLLLLIGAFVVVIQPGSSGVVASLRLADGSEYMVTQRCNWSAEPYTVSFYMRAPGGKWGWCYIDHEANRWRDVTMTYDTNADLITVTERGTWQASLDRKRGVFAIGEGRPKREVAAPQEYSEPEFSSPR
jgi:hypothetical protein